jgi:ankyrin repeat protein
MVAPEDSGFAPPLFGIVEDPDDDPSLIEDFIAAGASSTATDVDLNTALHKTTQRTFAEVLLREGADPHARNTAGETPLHKACEREKLHLVEFFLFQGLDVNAATTHSHWTPLMYAVHEPESWFYGHSPGRFTLAKLLVQHGADVGAVAADGTTALHLAAESGAIEIFRLLIDQGADLHATTVARKTVLHSVCLRQDAAMPGWLSDFGRPDGNVASVALLEVLMDRGAVSDLEARDEEGRTALQLSFAFHDLTWIPELSNALLRRGANRMVTNDDGKTFVELVGASNWCFGEDGLLKERPKPVPARGPGGRGRGEVRGRGRGRGGV